MSKTYVVHLVADEHRMKPHAKPLAVLYEGDDKNEAEGWAMAAFKNPQHRGRWIRFYDFHLFGGGMRDTFIT